MLQAESGRDLKRTPENQPKGLIPKRIKIGLFRSVGLRKNRSKRIEIADFWAETMVLR